MSVDPRCRIGRVKLRAPGNVVVLDVTTRLDIPVSRVLAEALDEGLTEVVVSGTRPDGSSYYATSLASGPQALWLVKNIERALLG